MNKKFLIIGGIALALIALAFLFMPATGKKKTAQKDSGSDVSNNSSSTSSGFSNFSDAPNPGNEDSALETEAEKLWPHLSKQDTSAKRKEKVR